MNKLEKKANQKLPPHNVEAEQCVLGAILLENTAIYEALTILSIDDFYHSTHRIIFNAMLQLSDREEGIDLLTIKEEISEQDMKTVREAYLAHLCDVVPTAANISSHAKIIHEKAIARRLLNLSIDIGTRCYNENENPQKLLQETEQKLYEINQGKTKSGFFPISDLTQGAYSHFEEREESKSPMVGLSSSFFEIDRMTCGFQPGDLIVIAGRPAMGKTAIALNIANHLATKNGKHIAVFSLEMSKERLTQRQILSHAKVNRYDFGTGKLTDDDWQRLAISTGIVNNAGIYIDDTPRITLLEMRAKLMQLSMQYGLDLIIVDYLQLMTPAVRRGSEAQEVSELSRGLKCLAKELNVPLLALSQLNREVEHRPTKRPQLSDLRASGSIEQDADIIMFMFRPEVYFDDAPQGMTEVIFGKQREGPIGSIQLYFQAQYTRFENYRKDGNQVFVPENPLVA